MHSYKAMRTELVKVIQVRGTGLLARITISNYKGERWTIKRDSLTDEDAEKMRDNWTFMQFTDKYKKHVDCPISTSNILILDHHNRCVEERNKKMRAMREAVSGSSAVALASNTQ